MHAGRMARGLTDTTTPVTKMIFLKNQNSQWVLADLLLPEWIYRMGIGAGSDRSRVNKHPEPAVYRPHAALRLHPCRALSSDAT